MDLKRKVVITGEMFEAERADAGAKVAEAEENAETPVNVAAANKKAAAEPKSSAKRIANQVEQLTGEPLRGGLAPRKDTYEARPSINDYFKACGYEGPDPAAFTFSFALLAKKSEVDIDLVDITPCRE